MDACFDIWVVDDDIDWPYVPDDYDEPFDRSDYSEEIRDAEWSLVSKATDILDELVYKYNLDCIYDIDIEEEVVTLSFDNPSDKNKAVKVLTEFQTKLDGLEYKDEFTIYGNIISGGYPSYEPPEYEETEVEMTLYFGYNKEIWFK